jgi:hypothetical protein
MACNLASSVALGCKDSVGGIKRVYITELANKATLTKTAGVVTAFTLLTGKRFWVYDFEKETAELMETITRSDENGTTFYAQELKLRLNKRDTTKRNEIKLLALNDCMAIALDRNGTYWLAGEENGLSMQTSTSTLGKAMGDFNGFDLVLAGKEVDSMVEVTGSLIAGLIVPAS